MWFNDHVLGKSGQTANPIIAIVDPVPYYSIRMFVFANLLTVNVGKTHNSQLIDSHNYRDYLNTMYAKKIF